MTNEVATTTGTEVSTNVATGIASNFTQDDVQQGRLMVMQPNSTFVGEGNAKAGALVNIVDYEQFAYKGDKSEDTTDFEFMIIGVMKYWVVKDSDDNFLEKFPAANANELKWEEEVNGKMLKRTYHYSYIVLSADEIKDGIEQPYELSFRSTAVNDTKKLNSIIKKLAVKGVSSNQRVFKASVVERTKDNKKWWGLELGLSREATAEEEKTCTEYFKNFLESQEKFMSGGDAYSSTETKATVNQSDY